MRNRTLCSLALVSALLWCCCFISTVVSQSGGGDAAVMQLLKKGITQMGNLDWSDPNPCKWDHVQCNSENRVTRIQIGNQNLQGTLPPELNTLKALQRFEVMRNHFSGPLPSLAGLSSLQVLLLHDNNFSSVPTDFFTGMSALQAVDLGKNPFSPWRIPDSLRDAASLQNFSASSANIVGPIPDFLGGSFPGLMGLHLSFNPLEGGLPSSFAGSSIQSLWLNNFKSDSKLNGTIQVLQNMTMLREVWLHGNHFTGPLPDLSPVTELWSLSLRDNDFTGIVPASLVKIQSLRIVNLTNNHFQGSPPKFDTNVVQVDMNENCNSFCLNQPGAPCDPRIDVLLSIAEAMTYPNVFAENWKGNDPCNGWPGITCFGGNITVVNFQGMGLTGTISPHFSELRSLQTLILANNMLTGTLPVELVTLPNLKRLDVSHNNLNGRVPNFEQRVDVISEGNSLNSNLHADTPSGSVSSSSEAPSGNGSGIRKRAYEIGVIGGSVCGVMFLGLIGVAGFSFYKRRKRGSCTPNALAIHPRPSDAVKITVAASRVNGVGSETYSYSSSGLSDLHVVESGNNMVISIDGLRTVTDNFSDDNILGRGGFGTVYKGESHDGTKIAVKRMESGVITETGLSEFTSEIAVLTKVRHRHLVSFLGYCLDENERLLVYEYMPQGTLSRYLFNWKEEELKPLEWMSRLSIALDVARGVEYLHGLAHQSFIHRDLKPSNILLGDDMRAKVADFGLVRLAPDGKASFATKLAGTFGYLAPEYAVTGRVTTKVDVFSFGVILMEMITGRQAIDETIPDDSQHLVTWFRRIHSRKESFGKAIDQTINLDEETLASISTVAELAGHCCARESHQRPDMGHVVNVLSTLVESWKPADSDAEYGYGADLDTLLPDAVEKWRDSTVEECSIPISASGFADTSQHQW